MREYLAHKLFPFEKQKIVKGRHLVQSAAITTAICKHSLISFLRSDVVFGGIKTSRDLIQFWFKWITCKETEVIKSFLLCLWSNFRDVKDVVDKIYEDVDSRPKILLVGHR